MTDVFLHVPAGDHNPYESVPWARVPLEPFADEPVRVGVQAQQPFDSVTAEWVGERGTGSVVLDQAGAVWSGVIGPLAGPSQYRFVGHRDGDEPLPSAWHLVDAARWAGVEFERVQREGADVMVQGAHGTLRLTGLERSLAWRLERPSAVHGGAGREAAIGGWGVMVEDGGGVHLAHGDLHLVLRAQVATDASGPRAWRLSWALGMDEQLLGTGERFDSLDQRGRRPDIRVYEQYKGQGSRTYFPVPWLISSAGYGLAVDGAARSVFDLGATDERTAVVTTPTETASGRWYVGRPAELIEAYTADLGRRRTMPIWGYGPWMSSNEWNSQARVREVVDRTRAEDIPASVLVIEAWADEATFYLWNDTEYEPVDGALPVPVAGMRHAGRWPDPKGLIDWLHDRDIRVLLWQIPVLKDMAEDADMDTDHPQQLRDVAYAEQAGLTVRAGAETYRNRGWWFPRSRVIDLSNPSAEAWWFRKRAYLLEDLGVDGFKTDGGEHLWGADVRTFDGATGDEAANRYPTQYLAAYHRFLEKYGDGDELLFSRAGFTGSQLLPAHWAGDEDSTWASYRASLTAGLSAGVCGVAFWGWDIAGFSGPLPTSELYQRATAMATFCPIMQYHSEHNGHRQPLADRTPWNVAEQTHDDAVIEVYRRYAHLRMNLVPYLNGLGIEASSTGLPLMRAMALVHPEDPLARRLDDQYLLGPDLLVAPVLERGAVERQVYLPPGDWFDLWSGSLMTSGQQTVPAPLDTIPVFVRGGATIPLWMPEDACALGSGVGLPGDGHGRLVLMVSPGDRDSVIVEPLAGARSEVSVRASEGEVTISAPAIPDGTLVWVHGPGTDAQVRLAGGTASVPLP